MEKNVWKNMFFGKKTKQKHNVVTFNLYFTAALTSNHKHP